MEYKSGVELLKFLRSLQNPEFSFKIDRNDCVDWVVDRFEKKFGILEDEVSK